MAEKNAQGTNSENKTTEEAQKSDKTEKPFNFGTIGRMCEEGLIKTYLDYTKNQASPALFHIWTIVTCVAGILRRNVFIDRGGYYTLYPNLYVVLVAPSGKCMKSTAARIGVRLMRQVGDLRIMHEKVTPEGLISYMAGELDKKKKGGERVTMTQIITTLRESLTSEKKGDAEKAEEQAAQIEAATNATQTSIIIKQESTCFVFAPELAVFLGNTSYSSGLIELLTSLYEGKDEWEYRTKTGGTTELYNVCINMFGCSNPEWLAKGLAEDVFGGGFMGRTIYVYQDVGRKKDAWITRPAGMQEMEAKIVNDLIQISRLRGEFKVTDEAHNLYEQWHDAYNPDFSNRMAGYFERKPEHILKVCMVVSACTGNDLVIRKDHVALAIAMLDEVENSMPHAFAYIGATNEARIAQHVIEVVAGADNQFISYRRLIAAMRHLIKNRREFDDIIDTLETAGAIKVYPTAKGKYLTIDKGVEKIKRIAEQQARKAALVEFKAAKQKDLKTAEEEFKDALANATEDENKTKEENKQESPNE